MTRGEAMERARGEVRASGLSRWCVQARPGVWGVQSFPAHPAFQQFEVAPVREAGTEIQYAAASNPLLYKGHKRCASH
jgi:hypothetical protein